MSSLMWRLSYLTLLWVCLKVIFCPVSAAVLHTSGRWILDSNNHRVKLRCVNWAGHMETNIPEGLQHQPVETIASWIATAGFNCVRLTYSTDMAVNPDQPVSDSFNVAATAAGVSLSSMQSLYKSAVQKNPFLSSASTRSTFAKVIDELAAKNILVILDNHVSRASWCCSTTDGNGWWASASGYSADNSRYFDTSKWLAGLSDMATFAASHPNIVGMSLRNELRAVGSQDKNGHADWYNYVDQGARAIHSSNRNLLIVIGGVSYATDASFLYSKPLDRSAYPDRVVWEFHNYAWSFPEGQRPDCGNYQTLLGSRTGFLLTQGKAFTGPLWLSEFGYAQVSTSREESAYVDCLVAYMEGNDAEWAYWALQGSYYVRDGKTDADESYGLLNKDWSAWRNSSFVSRMGSLWSMTQGP